ncbi:MAG TPA: DsbA family oxidoreductase [Acidimicrobiales bacterium]|jgi:predicted DsbA family dithiol-disulfide isomerase|nr:DsbA family oxidoreductase [Acidimicrobiales bacterium]
MPLAYIGKRRFESALAHFEHADHVEIRWRSFELDPNAPLQRPGTMSEHMAARSGSTVEQAAADLAGIDELAAAEGLKLNLARTEKANTFAAHRLVHLGYVKDAATGAAVKEALLDACFGQLQLVSEPEVLLDVGLRAALDRAEVASVLEGDRFADEVRAHEAQAAALGCTGVPFFVFDRAFAVSGAQDSATFSMALQRAWEKSHPLIEVVVPSATSADGMVCTDDSCTL